MQEHKKEGLVYFSYSIFNEHREIVHVISTRLGGTSKDPYDSLNLGLHVGDEDESVLRNRAILCRALGIDRNRLVSASQVHGARVRIVTSEDSGKGALSQNDSIPETDALVTDVPGIPLMILVADCVIVSLYDPKEKVIALSHASWRGTLGGIAAATIAKMEESFGCRSENIIAGISPSIGPCCYEVGHDVIDAFLEKFPEDAKSFFPKFGGRKAYLDLWAANRIQLVRAGIKESNIESAEMCTSCRNDLFFSYRAQKKKTGRFCGLIMLKEEQA